MKKKLQLELKNQELIDFDSNHLWHPYALPYSKNNLNLQARFANKSTIEVEKYGNLIDAMSSWWCVIHGYNHKKLNQAIEKQLKKFSHIMFGGLTHKPAIKLGKKLLEINSDKQNNSHFQSVFFADSGSVSVEVAIKMALQYQTLKGKNDKTKIMSLFGGYHGDTLAAMSVCDPIKGMHQLFKNTIPKQIFGPKPPAGAIDDKISNAYKQELNNLFKENHQKTAAFIIEPLVQGAGGMHFYSAEVLNEIRKLCDQYGIVLIFDEIATGFGRLGKLFAHQYTKITPDILCLGKAMSGGYLNIAAVLVKKFISDAFDESNAKMMHGPTFMANPLACSVSLASIELLLQKNWQKKINKIETTIKLYFDELNKQSVPFIKNTRVLGAIGVIELTNANLSAEVQQKCLAKGIWIRPFGELVYIMPPYCIKNRELIYLCSTLCQIIKSL